MRLVEHVRIGNRFLPRLLGLLALCGLVTVLGSAVTLSSSLQSPPGQGTVYAPRTVDAPEGAILANVNPSSRFVFAEGESGRNRPSWNSKAWLFDMVRINNSDGSITVVASGARPSNELATEVVKIDINTNGDIVNHANLITYNYPEYSVPVAVDDTIEDSPIFSNYPLASNGTDTIVSGFSRSPTGGRSFDWKAGVNIIRFGEGEDPDITEIASLTDDRSIRYSFPARIFIIDNTAYVFWVSVENVTTRIVTIDGKRFHKVVDPYGTASYSLYLSRIDLTNDALIDSRSLVVNKRGVLEMPFFHRIVSNGQIFLTVICQSIISLDSGIPYTFAVTITNSVEAEDNLIVYNAQKGPGERYIHDISEQFRFEDLIIYATDTDEDNNILLAGSRLLNDSRRVIHRKSVLLRLTTQSGRLTGAQNLEPRETPSIKLSSFKAVLVREDSDNPFLLISEEGDLNKRAFATLRRPAHPVGGNSLQLDGGVTELPASAGAKRNGPTRIFPVFQTLNPTIKFSSGRKFITFVTLKVNHSTRRPESEKIKLIDDQNGEILTPIEHFSLIVDSSTLFTTKVAIPFEAGGKKFVILGRSQRDRSHVTATTERGRKTANSWCEIDVIPLP